jgi:hypothetical protein
MYPCFFLLCIVLWSDLEPDMDCSPKRGYLTGPLWAGPAHEAHDPPPVVGIAALQQSHRNAQRHAGRAQRSLSRRHGPGIPLQLA